MKLYILKAELIDLCECQHKPEVLRRTIKKYHFEAKQKCLYYFLLSVVFAACVVERI